MYHIRLKISIHLSHNHALSEQDLKALKPVIQRAVAGCLPDGICVDTVAVTRIKEATRALPEDSAG